MGSVMVNKELEIMRNLALGVDCKYDFDNINWRWLLKLTLRNMLPYQIKTALKYKFYKGTPLFKQLPFIEYHLSRAENNVIIRNTLLFDSLKSILLSLNEAEIFPILLKGVYLHSEIYKDIRKRPMYDIDIMVKKEDVGIVNSILDRAGYECISGCSLGRIGLPSSCNSRFYRKKIGNDIIFYSDVHLHWSLINSGRPFANHIWKLDIEDLWKNARWGVGCGGEVTFLSREYTLMHMLEHAVKHNFRQFIKIIDIIQFLVKEKINWNLFYEICVKQNFEMFAGLGLEVVYEFISEDQIDLRIAINKILHKLKKSGYLSEIFKKSVLKGEVSSLSNLIFYFDIQDRKLDFIKLMLIRLINEEPGVESEFLNLKQSFPDAVMGKMKRAWCRLKRHI